jgi:uncharacterized protein (DUF1501 family)
VSRRDFLRLGLTASALGALLSLKAVGIASAATPPNDYRALVCVHLYGGNDGFNMLVPRDNENYGIYQQSRQVLALPQGSLLPIQPKTSDGRQYGLHPSLPDVQQLFNSGSLALVANLGTLLAPTTVDDYNAGLNLPPQLFSHADQVNEWMSGKPESSELIGWGGRIGEILQPDNMSNGLNVNISIDGNNLFQTGPSSLPYSIGTNGVAAFQSIGAGQSQTRSAAFNSLLSQAGASAHLFEQQGSASITQALDLTQLLSTALANAQPITTAFPGSYLGAELSMVAQLIATRAPLGASRQIFFVSQGGYDTHDGQLAQQGDNFSDLSACFGAFYRAMVELGVAKSVTLFTTSDFGRTLSTNNDGTDHGWGSTHMVMGGAVNGGDIYGTFPDLHLGSANDAEAGRFIPTTSTYQYDATLATWMGVSNADISTMFPNLSNFNTPNLGFMSA